MGSLISTSMFTNWAHTRFFAQWLFREMEGGGEAFPSSQTKTTPGRQVSLQKHSQYNFGVLTEESPYF